MKKIIALVMTFMLFVTFCVQGAYIPSFTENFDTYKEGTRSVRDFYMTAQSKEHIYVTDDPTSEGTNKVLKFEGTDDAQSYFQTANLDLSKKTEISFKLYRQTDGAMNIYLRDKNGTANNLYIFSVSKNNVVFGSGTHTKKVEFGTEKWAEFKIEIDQRNDLIKYYSDLANAGTLTLECSFKMSEAYTSKYENHYYAQTIVRFTPQTSNTVCYFDDLSIMSDMSVQNGISITGVNAFRVVEKEMVKVDNLRGGSMIFNIHAKSEEENKTAMLLAGIYSKDGLLKKFAASEKVTLENSFKEILCKIDVGELEEGDTASLFMIDSMQNISPLCEKIEIDNSEMYFRPAGEEALLDLYTIHPTADAHPRTVLTKDDFDELREFAKTDSDYMSMFNKFTKAVAGNDGVSGYLTYKQPVYDVETAGTLLTTSRNVMNRVIPMAYMYQMTGEEKYAQGVWRQIEPVCDEDKFPDWHPAHFLDTGEMSLAVSLAYDWCYGYWTNEQREYIEQALYRNIIKLISETADGRASYTAPSAATNWGPVCGGGAVAAATALAHVYPQECGKVISYCTKSVENAIKDYAPDGGYSEGPTYWDYGTTYLVWLISSLESACGTEYGLLKSSGLDVTGYFPSYITGPKGAFNYHDSSGEGSSLTNKLAYYFADRFNDKNLGGIRYNALRNGIYGMSQGLSVTDMLFYNPENINKNFSYTDLPRDKYIRGIETVTMKENMDDSNAAFLTLHGGYDNANHGNLDSGTFVLDAGGVRWFKDIGGGSYDLPGYFSGGVGGNRWKYYVNRAEGQNTLVINPTQEAEQYPTSTTYIEKFKENGDDGAFAILDMTPAYEKNYALSVKRGAMLTNNRKTMIIQDEVSGIFDYDTETDGYQSVLYWFAHTAANIEISSDGKSAILTQSGKRLHAQLVSEDENLSFSVSAAEKLETSPEKHELEATYSNLRKLTVKAEDKENVKFAVVFNLLEENQTQPEYEYAYLSLGEW